MTPFRFFIFFTLLALSLSGFGGFSAVQAQEALRAEIEVNTTVLDELEGYQPPPMFGAPDRPVLSRPIERLALPQRAVTPEEREKSLKKQAENRKLRLAKPVIDPAPARTATIQPEKIPAPPRARARPQAEKSAAPVPSVKPGGKPAPALLARTAPVKKDAARKKPPVPPKDKALMPAMPAQTVARETLDSPPAALPLSEEEILAASATSASAQELARLEPAAGGSDITAYEAASPEIILAAADISAGSALKSPPSAEKKKRPEKHDVFQQASLDFRKGQTDLESEQAGALKDRIAAALGKNKAARVQIQAFASAADEGQSSARRVSLLRALAVRGWLVAHGVSPARIDVRALGDTGKDGKPDRIDLVVFDPVRMP